MNNAADVQESPSNRDIALRFLAHCFRGEMESALQMLAEDATWWVPGNAEKIKVCGWRDLPRIRRLLDNVRRGWPEGMEVRFEGVTAEGERVAVEAESRARMADGRDYQNRYHYLLIVRSGRVAQVREYMDTQYVYEVQQASAPLPRDS